MNCALCGNYKNYKNMVLEINEIKNKKGKSFKLKNQLDCKNYGIYGAKCLQCHEYYIGQTKNKFSIRWNAHRSSWKEFYKNNMNDSEKIKEEDHTDARALFGHYTKKHKPVENIYDAYKVFFIEQPRFENLDLKESV